MDHHSEMDEEYLRDYLPKVKELLGSDDSLPLEELEKVKPILLDIIGNASHNCKHPFNLSYVIFTEFHTQIASFEIAEDVWQMAREAHELFSIRYYAAPRTHTSEDLGASANDENARGANQASAPQDIWSPDPPPMATNSYSGAEVGLDPKVAAELNDLFNTAPSIETVAKRAREFRDSYIAAGIKVPEELEGYIRHIQRKISHSSQDYCSSVKNNASAAASLLGGHSNIYGDSKDETTFPSPRSPIHGTNRVQDVTDAVAGLDTSDLAPVVTQRLQHASHALRETSLNPDTIQQPQTSGTSDTTSPPPLDSRDAPQVTRQRDYSAECKRILGRAKARWHREGLMPYLRVNEAGERELVSADRTITDRKDRMLPILLHEEHYDKLDASMKGKFDSLEDVGAELGFKVQLSVPWPYSNNVTVNPLPDPEGPRPQLDSKADRRFDILSHLGRHLGFDIDIAQVQWASGSPRVITFPIGNPHGEPEE
ncbi:uncharacterized protein PAC_07000 [Phialocephala subalpina]|uniref:Uncharacterized protein n=1 Tax=Phialocephala subalpina TaxID=576137 RepID=A0A1L7WWF6_9HELO|nr:uncharacterized protein PAC_07000 [Phialocephala subalpina]